MNVLGALVLLVVAGGVVVGAALVARRRVRLAVGSMLDLWTAAGLLRLAGDTSWGALGAAALLVVLRKVVAAAMKGSPALSR